VRAALGRVLRLDRGSAGFVPAYQELDEQLFRIANRTVTAFLHVSMADRRPRLAVYVRPKGRLGRAYMQLIEPFRRWVVYPAMLAAGSRAAARLNRDHPSPSPLP
jgi:acyl carrier protein phosphodiesterase